MLKRLLPGGTGSGGANTKGIFYYPRFGFGQICNALYQACLDAGVDVRLNAHVIGIQKNNNKRSVVIENDQAIEADQVYSTIPLTILANLIDSEIPTVVQQAIDTLEFRAMTLVYLQLDQHQFTEYDAHYFPGADLPFTRISETRNYTDRTEPQGTTVLCAEIPCFVNDDIWNMSAKELGTVVSDGLAKAGLPLRSGIKDIQLRRIPFAYPLYRNGYETKFETLDNWLDQQQGVLSFGRQGLYAHDNTHHAMFMAKAAAECLRPDGSIDEAAWKASRNIFEKHVVED